MELGIKTTLCSSVTLGLYDCINPFGLDFAPIKVVFTLKFQNHDLRIYPRINRQTNCRKPTL